VTKQTGCTEYYALERGKQLIKEKFPRSYSQTQPIEIFKEVGYWRISGTLPPQVAGGVPTVKLHIDTCNLLEISHTQ